MNGKKAEVLQEISESYGHLQKAIEERKLEIEQEVEGLAEQYLEKFKVLST